MAQSLSMVNKEFVSNLKKGLYEGNIPKGNIKDDIQLCINSHNVVISIFDKLESSSNTPSLMNSIRKNLKDKTTVVPVYNKYMNALSGRAKIIEEKSQLLTIKRTNVILVELLKELNKNIDELIKTKSLNIHNTKISHVMVLGILEESKICAQYSILLTNMVLNSNIKVITNPPKYKTEYLKDNNKRVATTVSNIFMKTGIFNFLTNIKNLKSTNTDVLLLNDDDQSNLEYVANNSNGTSGEVSRLVALPLLLNPFRWFGILFARASRSRYEKNVESKEWLEAQIQLLKLQLDGVPPDDKRAIQLQKIIKAYEDMLSKRNRDIAKYQEQ